MDIPIWCLAVARSFVPKDANGKQDESLVERTALTIWIAHARWPVIGGHHGTTNPRS